MNRCFGKVTFIATAILLLITIALLNGSYGLHVSAQASSGLPVDSDEGIKLAEDIRLYYPVIMSPESMRWINDSTILVVTEENVFLYNALDGKITFTASIPSSVVRSHTRTAYYVDDTIIIIRYDEVYFIKTIPINDTYYPTKVYSITINPIGVANNKLLGFRGSTIYALDPHNFSVYPIADLNHELIWAFKYNSSCILTASYIGEEKINISIIDPWSRHTYWNTVISGIGRHIARLNTETDTLALVTNEANWISGSGYSALILIKIGGKVVYNKTIHPRRDVEKVTRIAWIDDNTLLIVYDHYLYFMYDIQKEKLDSIGLWRNVARLDKNLIALIKGNTVKIALTNSTRYNVVKTINTRSDAENALKKGDLIAIGLFGRDIHHNPVYWIGGVDVYSINGSFVSGIYTKRFVSAAYAKERGLILILSKPLGERYMLVTDGNTPLYRVNLTEDIKIVDVLAYASGRVALLYEPAGYTFKGILVIDAHSNKTLLDLRENATTKIYTSRPSTDAIQVAYRRWGNEQITFYTINLSDGGFTVFTTKSEKVVSKIVGTGDGWITVDAAGKITVFTIDGDSIATLSLSDIARNISTGYDEVSLHGINRRGSTLAVVLKLDMGARSEYYLAIYDIGEKRIKGKAYVKRFEWEGGIHVRFIEDRVVVYSRTWYRVYALPSLELVNGGSKRVLGLINGRLYMMHGSRIELLRIVDNTSKAIKLCNKVLNDKTISGLIVKAINDYYVVLEGETYTHIVRLDTGKTISIQTLGSDNPSDVFLDEHTDYVALVGVGLYIIGNYTIAWSGTQLARNITSTTPIMSPSTGTEPPPQYPTAKPQHTPINNTGSKTKPTATTGLGDVGKEGRGIEWVITIVAALIVVVLAVLAFKFFRR